MQRALTIATNPNDLVLDSFLGSGTTAAVAHKMGRHWIGIEMGEHALTHCLPRLEKVIAGEQGGISAAVGWQVTPLIGTHDGRALYLLYNGILGDRRPEGGNVLTLTVLQALKAIVPHDGPKVVYAEACRLGDARLAAENIVFRQIPYELAGR